MTEPQPARTIRLQNLPHGVLAHIAAYLTRGRHTEHALYFAQTCSAAREAVLDALSYRINYTTASYFDGDIFDHLDTWTRIFANSSRYVTVNLLSPRWTSCNDYNDLRQVPERCFRQIVHNIHKVSIPYQPKWLHVLRSAPRLRELRIRTRIMIDHRLLFDTLASLSLSSLTLCCSSHSRLGCVFNQHTLFDPRFGIKQACPSLTELRVECRCGCVLWPMLRRCPVLRRRPVVTPCQLSISCGNEMPGDVLRLTALHRQNRMRICERLRPCGDKSLSQRLSTSLTELCIPLTQKVFNSSADFACLAACSKLERVSIVMSAGAEVALAQVILNWPELRELELQWVGAPGRCPITGQCSAQITPGALLNAVQSAPKLRSIVIKEGSVSIPEVTAVMKALASRLTHVGVPLENQAEGALQRYEIILETATIWNPALRRIMCYYRRIPEISQYAVRKRLGAMMMRLERSAPYLSEYPLKHLFREPDLP